MDFLDCSALDWETGFDAQVEGPAADFTSPFAPCTTSHVSDGFNDFNINSDGFGLPDFLGDAGNDPLFLDDYNDFGVDVIAEHEPCRLPDVVVPPMEDSIPAMKSTKCHNSERKFSDEMEQPGKKSRRRFPREAVQLLKAWLRDHADNPYPTDKEMDQLKKDTGLKRSQIRTWLANTRRRSKMCAPMATPSSSTTQESCSTGSTISTDETPSYDKLTPFDRYGLRLLPLACLILTVPIDGVCLVHLKNLFRCRLLPTP